MKEDTKTGMEYFHNKKKLTKAQVELYKYLKRKNDKNENIQKSDIMYLYCKYAKTNRPYAYADYSYRWDEQQIYRNASNWLNSCLVTYIRRGHVLLNFNMSESELEKDITNKPKYIRR